MRIRRMLCNIIVLFSAQAWASDTAHQRLTQQLELYMDQILASSEAANQYRYEFEIGNIDPRLNIKECGGAVVVKLLEQPLKSKNTLKATCEDGSNWKVHIPVKVRLYKDVVVAAKNIVRGQRIKPGDLAFAEKEAKTLSYGFYTSTQDLTGMQASRTISAGKALRPGLITAPEVVKRGDSVVIRAKSQIIEVVMPGTALTDGKVGQQIPVRNTRSNRVIKATVKGDALVEVRI